MTFSTELLSLKDGTKIAAPANLLSLTNYVLKEQQDWFEDEIHFVRQFIKPEMNVLDIGANYGLYTTAIAKNLGSEGHLWSFEPTPNTAGALKQTIEENQLEDKVSLIEAGVSNRIGEATFYTSDNAELNSLTESESLNGEQHSIQLVTLDQCKQEQSWPKIDFIKLDAEGEEANILEGAAQLLAEDSPLIMFELKHGDQVNSALIEQFKDKGYKSYYLIPSLNVLIPLGEYLPVDKFLLNLFCCKDDTAAQLEEQGYLIRNCAPNSTGEDDAYAKYFGQSTFFNELELADKTNADEDMRNALNAYAQYRQSDLNKKERLQNLLFTFEIVKKKLGTGVSNIQDLSSIARIAFDAGQRAIGLQVCNHIVNQYFLSGKPFGLHQTYLPINDRYETLSLGETSPNAWFSASILEETVNKHAFSTYYSGAQMVPFIEKLETFGLCSESMQNQKSLIEQRIALEES